MKANEQTTAEILSVMNNYMTAYQNRDLEGLLSNFVPDEDQVHFGTGADERRVGRDQLQTQVEQDWAQTDDLNFNITWQQISTAGPVAWLSAEGFGEGKAGGYSFSFPVRMSGVFEKREGKWYVAQSHLSLPAPDQDPGDSVPV